MKLKSRRFLYTILADFLSKKGYDVEMSIKTSRKWYAGDPGVHPQGVAIGPIGLLKAWVILKRGTNILGVSVPSISQGTQDYSWTLVGNIHDPELLDKLIKMLNKRKILPRDLD